MGRKGEAKKVAAVAIKILGSGSMGNSKRTRSNAGLTTEGSGWADVSGDIRQSHDFPLRQQLH